MRGVEHMTALMKTPHTGTRTRTRTRTHTHFECAMASRFLVAGFSSISAMEKAAAMATKVTRASTATATWMRYGMLQQSVKRGSRPGFRDRWFRV